MSNDDTIYVTKPFMPPLEEFLPYLSQIWETGTLTNGGPFHQQLEEAAGDYLGVEHRLAVHQRDDRAGHGAPGAAHHG